MRYRASPAQRDLVVRLFQSAGLDTRTISLMHKPVFEAAAQWCSADNGRPMNEILDTLTTVSASRLIDALQDFQEER